MPRTVFRERLTRVDNPSVKGASIQDEVVDIGLLIFPDLGWGVLADGVDKAVGVKHRHPFIYGRL